MCPCGLRVPCTPGCEGVSVGVSPCVTLSPVACTPAWVCSLSWLVQSCGQSVWPVLQGEAPACGPLGCEIRGLSPWPAWLQVLLWSCVRAREARDRAMSRQTQGSGQRAEQEGSRGPGIMSLRAAPKLSPQRSAPTPTGSFAHHSHTRSGFKTLPRLLLVWKTGPGKGKGHVFFPGNKQHGHVVINQRRFQSSTGSRRLRGPWNPIRYASACRLMGCCWTPRDPTFRGR